MALYARNSARKVCHLALRYLCYDLTCNSLKEVTLVLCKSSNIARTSIESKDDGLHIETLLSLQYIEHSQHRVEDEVTGLLIHEIAHSLLRVHPDNKFPSGLLVGIAGKLGMASHCTFFYSIVIDYVRLKEEYGPPHWSQNTRGSWDDGFEKTAYFLDWIEKKRSEGTIRKLTAVLKSEYHEDLFRQITGVSVSDLWKQYCEHVESNYTVEENTEVVQESSNPLTSWPMPKLNIRVEDLDHEGVDIFFDAVKPKDALKTSVLASFNQLYTLTNVPTKYVIHLGFKPPTYHFLQCQRDPPRSSGHGRSRIYNR